MTTSNPEPKFSSRLYDVPRLDNDGKNFQTWKFRIMMVLDIRGLQDIVTGKEVEPPIPEKDEDSKAYDNWVRKDKDARAQLTLTLEDEPLNGVLFAKSAKDTWDKLNARYEGKGKQTIAYLISELFRGTLSDETAMEPQLNTMQQKAHIIRSLGQPLDDHLIATAIIISLPPSYATLSTILMASDSKLSVDMVSARILTEEKNRRNPNSATALVAKVSTKGKGKKDRKKNKKCDHCKKQGHLKFECRKLKAETEGKEKEKSPELSANQTYGQS